MNKDDYWCIFEFALSDFKKAGQKSAKVHVAVNDLRTQNHFPLKENKLQSFLKLLSLFQENSESEA